MQQVVTIFQQQVGAQQQALQQVQAAMDAQQASAALRNCFVSSVGRHVGSLEPERGRGSIGGGSWFRDTQMQSVHRVSSILAVVEF